MNDDSVRASIDQMLRPGHFFLATQGRLQIDHRQDVSLLWEVFRGHLLDESKTRVQKTFESWNVFVQPAEGGPTEPLLAVLFARSERVIYVTRVLIGITLMIGSFRRTVSIWSASSIRADVYITTELWRRGRSAAAIDDDLVAVIASQPGVRAVDRLRQLLTTVENRRLPVAGVKTGLPGEEAR